ncbi:MAG: ABC transporter ATP-binding protein [Haliea sp.]|jgi:ATP-binding cassette subfamily F protein uup|uniref:ATP-binding cassette domain-containing protein n=1 Tax=Haliea sp. TaxID=1932666 RepID=UPI000C38507B|nr:ATP-binding cassette domain-containing protein [Haliea sp.]MBM67866.1 ABC transporter ATP-binding protein [Haliea sp.]|tara:strand:+ start:3163 stop:5052 length:1890 start_codon:yes stop_codon:yes gene_type:complete
MPLLKLESLQLHYGTQVLLDDVGLTIRRGERWGLLGRNGAGKTTLLRVLAGELQADSGERWVRPGVRIARLEQTLPDADNSTVYDVVAEGLADTGKLLAEYHRLLHEGDDIDFDRLSTVQQALEAADGWTLQQRVETTITQLQLPQDAKMGELSGGWRRRVALARALVADPDILLLDEPTNHLDIPAIQWLETQLQQYRGAIVLITHDRRFLQSVATRIAELDRGHLTSWEGSYQGFLAHREQELEAEERANALFDKKLAQEEVWIRQGIKARRTRNEGRVRALEKMRSERQQRRERVGSANFVVEEASRSGKVVAELEQVSKRFDGKTVIRDFSTIIQRGDRVGIVGPNGAGKSTLVKMILGQLQPDEGRVTLGTKLEIAYSDQLRGKLEPEKNLIDNVCGGQEFIELNGKRRHAISYLGDFLFSPERVRTPVKALSGGEQNRAILARLFSKPANLLVLDEPTNDLDIETLELLEDILLSFDGTVILVSHDRDFMDHVVTQLLILRGDGTVEEQAGGYSDWEARGGQLVEPETRGQQMPASKPEPATSAPAASTPARRKLSYKEQRELDALPARIEALEQQQAALEARTADPAFYQQSRDAVDAVLAELSGVQDALDAAIERWAELES